MGKRKITGSAGQPSAPRRALLTGGAAGLAVAVGSTLGRAQPAFAQTTTPDWYNVTNYGAVAGGSTDTISGAISTIMSAINSGGTGGVIYIPAGSWTVKNTITIAIGNSGSSPVYIAGDGRDVTILNYSGSGACIHMYNPTSPGTGFPGIGTWGGGVLGLTIDGSGTTAQSSGLHIGDGEEYQVDLKVRNFTQAGSFGIHIDNTVWWVGRMHAKAQIVNCDTAVSFDVTSSSQGSVNFGYSDYAFDIFNYQQQNGVTIKAGAHPYNSVLRINGEWEQNSATSNFGTLLTVTGTFPSGPASQLTNCELHVHAEMNGGGGLANPQTILLGSSSNKIKVCQGDLVFINSPNQGAWQPASGFTAGQDQFGFTGTIIGDTSLAPGSTQGNTPPLQLAGAPLLYAPGSINGSSGTLYIGNGDFFQATLSGSNGTVSVGWGASQNPQAGPQRKTIVLSQPASGTIYKISWPKNSTPTLNTPTVLWAGGSAPQMTQAHGATDVYYLETYDGITWYGLASQNVS